jgi:hypothetical protein
MHTSGCLSLSTRGEAVNRFLKPHPVPGNNPAVGLLTPYPPCHWPALYASSQDRPREFEAAQDWQWSDGPSSKQVAQGGRPIRHAHPHGLENGFWCRAAR